MAYELILYLLAILGLVLSAYSVYTEFKISKNKNYKPVCDISDKISCSKAFESKSGKMFFISNSVWGVLFYLLMLVLLFSNYLNFVLFFSLFSVLVSIYFAFQLYREKIVCVVCVSIYIVNLLLLDFSYLRL